MSGLKEMSEVFYLTKQSYDIVVVVVVLEKSLRVT